jgi:hypothetical protein
MFCVPGPVLGGTEGARSNFHVLRSQTHFRRYQGRHVQFSCFALPDSFSVVRCAPVSFSMVSRASGPVFMYCAPRHIFLAVPRVSGLIVMFCAPRLVLGGTEGVRFSFFYLALLDPFSEVPRAWGPIFMFYAPELIFRGIEGLSSRFHVLCSGLVFGCTEGARSHFNALRTQTHFRWYRAPQVPISCFALPNYVWAVPSLCFNIIFILI